MTILGAKTLLNGNAVFTEFKSALTEQFVFQYLRPKEDLSIHYFPFDGKYEVDFMIQNGEDEIIPIEVKAGENLRAQRIKLFCEKYQPKTAVRTCLSNYQKESWMTNVPLYVTVDYF